MARTLHLIKNLSPKQADENLTVGRMLTDGRDSYRVIDRHHRIGELWIHLANEKLPELNDWYRVADCGELALKGRLASHRQVRRYGIRSHR